MDLTWDPNFEMGPESSKLAALVWPAFLAGASDIPQPGLELEIDADIFFKRYPAWGLRNADGKLVAYTNAIMIHLDPASNTLPDDGWQYAIENGAKDIEPNGLCLVVANVDPSVQNQGIAKLLIEKAKQEARAAGLKYMWAPVRPSNYQGDIPFDDYVSLRREDGQLVDPWLRAHERAGATKLNICHKSATVTATPARWTRWTGIDYPRSGVYPLARGLSSLRIDLEKNIGTYEEPNVWFRYIL